MKVLIISPGQDNGGIGYAIKKAFDWFGGPGWEVRSVRTSDNYIRFPADVTVSKLREVHELYRWADLVHMMEYFSAIEWAPGWESKPRLLHHHSATANPQIIERAKLEHVPQICALPTVAEQDADITWLPNPCDNEYLAGLRELPLGRIRPVISQSPSGWAKNGTERFLEAFEAVKGRADLDLIERLPWRECMVRKAKSDIGFDSFTTGYGISGMEYMAMGIPLISGSLDEAVEGRIMDMAGGYLPYHPTSHEDLPECLSEMVDLPNLRLMTAQAGLQYVESVHAEHVVVDRLKAIYERTMEDW